MKKIIIAIMAILTIMSLASCSKKEELKEEIIGKVWIVGSTDATITVLSGDNKYEKDIESYCTVSEYEAIMAAYDSGVIDEWYAFDKLFADQLTGYSE